MRGVLLALVLVTLAACGDQRSFDEQFNDTSSELENRARRLDQNLAESGTTDRVDR